MSEQQENTADDLGDYSLDDEDQLQPEDTLVDDDVDDVLDRGYSPADRPQGSLAHGVTAEEQHRDETIDERIHQEVPDPTSAYGAPDNESGLDDEDDRLGGDDPDSIAAEDDWLGDGEVGDARAGRLVAPDEGVGYDDEKDLVGEDVGIDGAGGLGRGGRDARHRREPVGGDSDEDLDDGPRRPVTDAAAAPQRSVTDLPKAHLHLHFTGSMRVATVRDLAAQHGIRLPSSLTDGLAADASTPLTRGAGSASSGSTTPRGRACAARRTCAGSCARPRSTTGPRGRGGWRSRSTRRRTHRSSAGSPRPWRSSSTRLAAVSAVPGAARVAVVVAASRMRHPLEARTLARLAARYAGDGRRRRSWASGCRTTSGAA